MPLAACLGMLMAISGCTPGRGGPKATALGTPQVGDSTPAASTETAGAASANEDAWLGSALARVDPEALMGHVIALSGIPSRHVNSPGIRQAADTIELAFAENGVRVEIVSFELEFQGIRTDQRNLIGVIPGTDPAAPAILLGAHYDSRTTDLADGIGPAPGANDNATGVAVLLEVGRLLAEAELSSTVYLAAFSAEETGLQGSRAVVEAGRSAPIAAVVIFDIVGNSSGPDGPSAIRLFSAGPDESASRGLARRIAGIGEAHVPELPVWVEDSIDRPGRYSDHVPFSEAGIPAVRFIEAGEHLEWQHNALDTADRLDPGFLARVARLALAIAFDLARAGPDSSG